MQVELGEIITFGAAMIGACWILLKISASQHEKRMDERHLGLVQRMDREFKLIYERTSSNDALSKELAEAKLDLANYKAHVATTFCARAEVQALVDRHADSTSKALERIEASIKELFRMLEHKEDRRHAPREGHTQ